MKLIIQIPCYNEAATLGITLRQLPREIPGVDDVEWLVVDDGSTDDTVAVAIADGVDHVVRHPQNLGLARAFMTGLSASLERGADIIVNTDADNQYDAADIPRLIEPIVSGRADFTLGIRPINSIQHFSRTKRFLEGFGSRVVQWFSGLDVADAPSGFRAYSRNAALRLNVFSRYTYTLETLIQAGQSGLLVETIPIHVNPELRESRLVRGPLSYVVRSIHTMVRIFITYRPFATFLVVGSILVFLAVLFGVRFLFYYFSGNGSGHVQSLILAAILSLTGFQLWVLGILADIISVNRRLLEDIQYKFREHLTREHNSAGGKVAGVDREQRDNEVSSVLETGRPLDDK